MCLFPRLIKNRKYLANKKNGGVIPPVSDNRVLWVAVGCGKCMECRKQKARAWQVRLSEEVKNNKNGVFVTLTFSDESIAQLTKEINKKTKLEGYELDNKISKIAVRRFLERWRKKYKKSIRHWLVTELGHQGTENIHLHGILFLDDNLYNKEEAWEDIATIWQYGFVWHGNKKENYVNERTVNYIVKYINKIDEDHKEYNSIVLVTPGIGAEYTKNKKEYNKYQGEKTREFYKLNNGAKVNLPPYYRNKIYSDEEREKLWIQLLDKGERYVLGQRIDIANEEHKYYEQLEVARNKNKRLGYGDDSFNWERKNYENIRRKELIQKRIDQAEKKVIIEPKTNQKESIIQPSKEWK